jgi:hypothetical protein
MDELSVRNLRKHGMERGAYNGANKRRFVLFVDEQGGGDPSRLRRRHEFDTKRERDAYARTLLRAK